VHCKRSQALNTGCFLNILFRNGSAKAGFNRGRRTEECVAGALPITVGDDVIGAIGVSGAPGGEKDEACAKAAIDKIADQLK
jgi:uncharacterized protein GlcG (DUF336 family)